MEYQIVQDVDKDIAVMHKAAMWLETSGKNLSNWWHPQNMNKKVMLQYAESTEFYVLLIDREAVAALVIQANERNQSWKGVDVDKDALYLHWLCIDPKYARKGLPKRLVDFAMDIAKDRGLKSLRVDTNAYEPKLRELYENLGFKLVAEKNDGYRKTAFYEMVLL